MNLGEARKFYDYFTGKASDITSTLAMAGIAVIWVFRIGEHATSIPRELLLPLALFVLTLLFHFLHYVIAGLFWGRFLDSQEKKFTANDNEEKIENAPDWINSPARICYGLKVSILPLGYFLLLSAIVGRL